MKGVFMSEEMLKLNVDGSVIISEDYFTKSQREAIEQLVETLKNHKTLNINEGVFTMFKDKNIFVRTVSYHQIGRCLGVKDGFLLLENASWVASSGRFNNALVTGQLDEVEPFPNGVILVGVASIVDVAEFEV
jgi:hypothetical protein